MNMVALAPTTQLQILTCLMRGGSFTVKSITMPTRKPGKEATLNVHLQPIAISIKLKAKAKLYPMYIPQL
jgi:hypothetical protein